MGQQCQCCYPARRTTDAHAGTSITRFSIELAAAGISYLKITADALTSSDDFSLSPSGIPSQKRSVGVHHLVAMGRLLEGKTLHVDGLPRVNTIIYHKNGLTLELNGSTTTSAIDCTPACTSKLSTFGAQTISILFDHVSLGRHLTTGGMVVGTTETGS